MGKHIKKVTKKFLRMAWRAAATGVIDIHLDSQQKKRAVRLLGENIWFPHAERHLNNKNTPTFYLKINRDAAYTLECIQMWLDIVDCLGADYYIVCDNSWLEHKVLGTCHFRDADIKVIPSMGRGISGIADRLYTGPWEAATHAHLTPFFHAQKNGIRAFWSIDADDTSFLLNPKAAARALKEVERLATREGIAAISLDMWLSRTHGQHWSFGVTFINDTVNFPEMFIANPDLAWANHYKSLDQAFNLDWYFTYLKDHRNIKIASFYIDDCGFVHWGDFLMNPFYSWVNIWSGGKIHYPILEHIFQNEKAGVLDIASTDCYRIDIGATVPEGLGILENEICKARNLPAQQRRLFKNDDFASHSSHMMNF